MKYDPTKHHRRSIRLKGYDYHMTGAYFVTICTKNRECVLEDPIVNAIINDVWLALPAWFPSIVLDEFVIMPDHIHFILWIINRTVGIPLQASRWRTSTTCTIWMGASPIPTKYRDQQK